MTTNRAKGRDDSLPLYDGSYYLIISRAVQALRNGTSVKAKVGGFTQQVGALGSHSRRRFRAHSVLGRLAVCLALLACGAAIAGGAYWQLVRSRPDALRARIRAHVATGDYASARRELDSLRSLGALTRDDRRDLAEPVRAHLDSMAAALRAKIESDREANRYDDARASLDDLDELDVDARWALFARAELERAAGRDGAAADAYGRFVRLYPDSDQADDALFWQALACRNRGELQRAKALLEELLRKYPRSNFGVSGRRMLAELTGH